MHLQANKMYLWKLIVKGQFWWQGVPPRLVCIFTTERLLEPYSDKSIFVDFRHGATLGNLCVRIRSSDKLRPSLQQETSWDPVWMQGCSGCCDTGNFSSGGRNARQFIRYAAAFFVLKKNIQTFGFDFRVPGFIGHNFRGLSQIYSFLCPCCILLHTLDLPVVSPSDPPLKGDFWCSNSAHLWGTFPFSEGLPVCDTVGSLCLMKVGGRLSFTMFDSNPYCAGRVMSEHKNRRVDCDQFQVTCWVTDSTNTKKWSDGLSSSSERKGWTLLR